MHCQWTNVPDSGQIHHLCPVYDGNATADWSVGADVAGVHQERTVDWAKVGSRGCDWMPSPFPERLLLGRAAQ